jgi:hypothetical protein
MCPGSFRPTLAAQIPAASRGLCYNSDVDRQLKLAHLAQARRHVAQGEEHVARQTRLVAELERDGHDTSAARRLLAQFIVMQSMHIEDCNRLEAELSDEETRAPPPAR